ncbi:MAG: tyrosine-type recombinase/integrase [Pseudonocardia sp.]|nr:tyrosine-type recombinase/integrase [Pseudonocardia sp.]
MTTVDTARITDAVHSSTASNTRRAYTSDWRRFTGWCAARGHTPLPAAPVTIAAYLTEAAATRTPGGQRAYAPATLGRWAAAIGHHHQRAEHPSPASAPLVAATLAGIRRACAEAGERPVRQVAPLLTGDITTILTAMNAQSDTWAARVYARRDAALLLLGFAAALRRSELVALAIGDVIGHRTDGLHLRIGRSKTDQDGRGAIRAVPFGASPAGCGSCAYLRWLHVVAAAETGGRPAAIRLLRGPDERDAHVCHGRWPHTPDPAAPVFRPIRGAGHLGAAALSGAAVHKMIRRRAIAAGYDAAFVARLGGHSLRAGFVTQAFRGGADAHAIMRQTGHASPAMLETYAREHAPLIGNAVTTLGL